MDMYEAVRIVLRSWGMADDPECETVLSGSTLHLRFEGVFFPEDEMTAALAPFLCSKSEGKIDVIDREAWRLRRYAVSCGRFLPYDVDLNHVLDYSGF